MNAAKHLLQLTAIAMLSTALPGCFLIIDDVDYDEPDYEPPPPPPPPPANNTPYFVSSDTWWACDYDPVYDEWYFEVQAVVNDWDGLGDVQGVDVWVYDADFGDHVDDFGLLDEGGGVYGAFVWESESWLVCGDPLDFEYETWDRTGDSSLLFLPYYG